MEPYWTLHIRKIYTFGFIPHYCEVDVIHSPDQEIETFEFGTCKRCPNKNIHMQIRVEKFIIRQKVKGTSEVTLPSQRQRMD
jgi:hypothetical protein